MHHRLIFNITVFEKEGEIFVNATAGEDLDAIETEIALAYATAVLEVSKRMIS